MGVDYSASLCVGIRMSDVFSIEKRKNAVTKYNPDTGVPYQTSIAKDKLIFFGKEIDEPDEDYPSEWIPNLTDLEVFTTGDWCSVYGETGFRRYDYDQIIIGEELADSGSSRSSEMHIKEIIQANIAISTANVKQKLAKFGYAGEVKLFLVHHVSC